MTFGSPPTGQRGYNDEDVEATIAKLDRRGMSPIRDDHAELLRRRALTEDAARPDAVERRRASNGRTARENIDDLVDAGSFVEYGRFAIAAQRFRRDLDDLIARTPADGLVAGTARINGEHFGERGAAAVLSYDYTVLAGTQGYLGHRKKRSAVRTDRADATADRVLRRRRRRQARRHRLPDGVVAGDPRVQAVGAVVGYWYRGSRS